MQEKDVFSYWVVSPDALEVKDIDILHSITTRYPYCQIGHALTAKIKQKGGFSDAAEALKTAAVYALSRKSLLALIDDDIEWEQTHEQTVSTTFKPVYRKMVEPMDLRVDVAAYDEDEKVVLESIFVDHTPVVATNATSTFTLDDLLPTKQELPKDDILRAIETPVKKSPEELIAQFIKKNPSIPPLKVESLPESMPTDLAARSQGTGGELATESMAEILVKQKKFERAIRIYEKLILKYPEKKGYFAEKINNISN